MEQNRSWKKSRGSGFPVASPYPPETDGQTRTGLKECNPAFSTFARIRPLRGPTQPPILQRLPDRHEQDLKECNPAFSTFARIRPLRGPTVLDCILLCNKFSLYWIWVGEA
ncbi:hypothetical protein CEXT_34041 [Caerostris extrusa]|uniref:Uncharacterized protein n=1 Tax=Caerostris extrusa TaxID=172846 RepID=A0AAV4P9V4_CAEEX|nr:hypothetical protein CEXT_34041 [Caerostris extrusa]